MVEVIESPNPPGDELGIKRFYVPGVVLRSKCPQCGMVDEKDLSDNYISYPQINEPTKVHFYCEHYADSQSEDEGCGHSWTEEVIVRIKIESCGGKDEEGGN